MQLIPEKEEKKSTPVDSRLEVLTSGDSALLDLLLFLYIECREEIILEEIAKQTEPEKEGLKKVLVEILQYIRQVKALMLNGNGALFGNCHRFAAVIYYAKEISRFPHDKKNAHRRDDYEQLLSDFEWMRKWDRTRKGLSVVINPKQGELREERLEHVFERVFSYVFQKYSHFIKLLKLVSPATWEVEITGPGGKISIPDKNKIHRSVFYCKGPEELAKFFSTFPELLPGDQQQRIVKLMPFYKEERVRINVSGHSVSVSGHGSFICVNDQIFHDQLAHKDYARIAHAIFDTHSDLYIKKRKAVGLFIQVDECVPLFRADAKERGAPEQAMPVCKIPSSLQLLKHSSLDRDLFGALLWLAWFNQDSDLFSHVSSQGLNVNVVSEAHSLSTPLMKAAEMGEVKLLKQLLDKGAEAFWVNADRETAFTLAEKIGHVEIIDVLMDHVFIDMNARQLYSAIFLMVGRMKRDCYPTSRDYEKIQIFLNKNVSKYQHGYYLKVIFTKIFIDHIKQAANPEKLKVAVEMTRIFKNLDLHHGHFFYYYIKHFPLENQYAVLNSVLTAFRDNKKATDTIRFFTFQYGLRHNHLLCDAMFAEDHSVLKLADTYGRTVLELGKSTGDEAILKKLQEMEAIAREARPPSVAFDAKSLPSSQKIQSAAAMYSSGVFFPADAKEVEKVLPAGASSLPIKKEGGLDAEDWESDEELAEVSKGFLSYLAAQN